LLFYIIIQIILIESFHWGGTQPGWKSNLGLPEWSQIGRPYHHAASTGFACQIKEYDVTFQARDSNTKYFLVA
jgi:hypothetical protein